MHSLYHQDLTEYGCHSRILPGGYSRFGDKYYKFYTNLTTFDVARAQCISDGGRLAQFDQSSDDYLVVMEHFKGKYV